jgi:valyl-tRNA synthetase
LTLGSPVALCGHTPPWAGPKTHHHSATLLPHLCAGDQPRYHHPVGGSHGDFWAGKSRASSHSSDVYIHPKISGWPRANHEQKSAGNGVDPLDIIEKYGTDALRFVMASMCTDNQDARMPVKPETQEDGRVINTSDKFEIGRNFANKLWNAVRFVQPHMAALSDTPQNIGNAIEQNLNPELFQLEDHWILSRVNSMVQNITQDLERYRFNEITRQLYSFIWDDLCSRYLEIKKHTITAAENTPEKRNAVALFAKVLHTTLHSLHPIMPFITEELNGIIFGTDSLLINSPWPQSEAQLIDESVEKAFENIFGIVEGVRSVRGRYSISPAKELTVSVQLSTDLATQAVLANADLIKTLGRLESLQAGTSIQKPGFSASVIFAGGELWVPLEGILDKDAELAKLHKELKKAQGFLAGLQKKLSNEKFTSNAPAEVIEGEKAKVATQAELIEKTQAAILELS